MSAIALEGTDERPTTSGRLASFLADEAEDGMSFEEFMQACADGEDGFCRPDDLTLCTRSLPSASACSRWPGRPGHGARAWHARGEALLGSQLGAFYTDDASRLAWLSTTDYPAIVTSAVRSLVDDLLSSWEADVLDVDRSARSLREGRQAAPCQDEGRSPDQRPCVACHAWGSVSEEGAPSR